MAWIQGSKFELMFTWTKTVPQNALIITGVTHKMLIYYTKK